MKFLTDFENISGAILSRSKESKVMGLGSWRGKQVWPLQWLRVVQDIKIFGFQVFPIYKQTLQQSWEACIVGFRKTIMSWKTRQLTTLNQRVQVLKIFATSNYGIRLQHFLFQLNLPRNLKPSWEVFCGLGSWKGFKLMN